MKYALETNRLFSIAFHPTKTFIRKEKERKERKKEGKGGKKKIGKKKRKTVLHSFLPRHPFRIIDDGSWVRSQSYRHRRITFPFEHYRRGVLRKAIAWQCQNRYPRRFLTRSIRAHIEKSKAWPPVTSQLRLRFPDTFYAHWVKTPRTINMAVAFWIVAQDSKAFL